MIFSSLPPLIAVSIALAMTSTQSSAFNSISGALASAPPSEISHGGKRWRLIEHTPNRYRNSKCARAWDLGQEYQSVEDASIHAWHCNFYPRDALIVLSNKQVNPANRHLQAKHKAMWNITNIEANVEEDEHISGLVQKANITNFHFYLLR